MNMNASRAAACEYRTRATTRRTVSSVVARWILYEYDYKCAHCKRTLPPTYELDHTYSLTHPKWYSMPKEEAERLANDKSNIQPLCRECHGIKTQREILRDAAVRRSIARSRAGRVCSECPLTHSPYFFPSCLRRTLYPDSRPIGPNKKKPPRVTSCPSKPHIRELDTSPLVV